MCHRDRASVPYGIEVCNCMYVLVYGSIYLELELGTSMFLIVPVPVVPGVRHWLITLGIVS